jgi:flagellar hook-associated protein 3 FlgL
VRVTFNASHRDNAAELHKAAERLLHFQRQVSSGKRVSRPSDDPSAASQAALERGRLGAVDQYSEAANSAKSRLLVADTVLSDVIDKIQDAKVAVLATLSGTITPEGREAKALELEGLRDSILRDLNTSFRGAYLFSGASDVAPYVKDALGVVSPYQGSTLETSIDIDRQSEVPIAFNGESLAKGSAVDDIFVVLDEAIDAARAGDTATLRGSLSKLDAAFTRATNFQGRIGAALQNIEDGQLRLGEAARSSNSRISALEDANMADAITGMTQAETAYRAALGATAQTNRLSLMDYLE